MNPYLKIIENIAAGFKAQHKIELLEDGAITIRILKDGSWQDVYHFSNLPR